MPCVVRPSLMGNRGPPEGSERVSHFGYLSPCHTIYFPVSLHSLAFLHFARPFLRPKIFLIRNALSLSRFFFLLPNFPIWDPTLFTFLTATSSNSNHSFSRSLYRLPTLVSRCDPGLPLEEDNCPSPAATPRLSATSRFTLCAITRRI